jgi:hypothetical protein
MKGKGLKFGVVGILLMVASSYAVVAQEDSVLAEALEKIRAAQLGAEAQKAIQQPEPAAEKKEDPFEGLPNNGVLASYGQGVGSQSAGGFGGLGFDAKNKVSPVTASIDRKGDHWHLTVSNEAEKQVQLQIRVVQKDKDGRQVKRDNISFSIPPKGNQVRQLNTGIGASQVVVELVRWKA